MLQTLDLSQPYNRVESSKPVSDVTSQELLVAFEETISVLVGSSFAEYMVGVIKENLSLRQTVRSQQLELLRKG